MRVDPPLCFPRFAAIRGEGSAAYSDLYPLPQTRGGRLVLGVSVAAFLSVGWIYVKLKHRVFYLDSRFAATTGPDGKAKVGKEAARSCGRGAPVLAPGEIIGSASLVSLGSSVGQSVGHGRMSTMLNGFDNRNASM